MEVQVLELTQQYLLKLRARHSNEDVNVASVGPRGQTGQLKRELKASKRNLLNKVRKASMLIPMRHHNSRRESEAVINLEQPLMRRMSIQEIMDEIRNFNL